MARDLLDELEAPPEMGLCVRCSADVSSMQVPWQSVFVCDDCPSSPAMCVNCVRRSHQDRPFDRLRMWDTSKRFWRKVSLGELGLQLCLGHHGERCRNAFLRASDMVVVHEHGVSDVPVVYCRCPGARPYADQLMLAGLWPATWENPQTATTISAVKIFDSLSNNGQLNVHDFIAHVTRLTDNVEAAEVKVSSHTAEPASWT